MAQQRENDSDLRYGCSLECVSSFRKSLSQNFGFVSLVALRARLSHFGMFDT